MEKQQEPQLKRDRIIGLRAGGVVFDDTPQALTPQVATGLYAGDSTDDEAEAAPRILQPA
jgi:ABC-type phosphate/phosphonate transport system ATPase subunit